MANITVVSTTNSIKVDFGVYGGSGLLEETAGCWRKEIIRFKKYSDHVKVFVIDEREWPVSYDGVDGTFQIDLINAVPPTSNNDLYTKLIALIA